MATSSWKHISGYPAREYRAYVTASIKSETATTATISVEGCCQARYMSDYGCRVRVYINGTQVDTDTAVIKNSSGTIGDWAEVSGTLVIDKGSAAKSITCKCTVEGETVSGMGGVNGGTASVSTTVEVKAITYSAPNAPTGFSSTRSSDTKNVLKWTKPTTTTTKPVTAILIERKVDGGSWSQIASVSGTSTSYNDTATSANHSYQYRIRSSNSAGKSAYVTSGTTYNTPSAPTKVTAARTSGNGVKLTITNAAKTATALEIQRSTDGATWEVASTVTGSNVTAASDNPGGGTFYYRARNTRGSLASAWSPASNAVVTICAPNAPTLSAPASGVVVSKEQEAVTFEWAHNPIDGSAQTAAKLRYSTDKGQTYTEVAIDGIADSYALENTFGVNSEVTWGVCTKGAHDDYGPWSGSRVFYVYQAPSVAFAEPADGFVVENTPIHVALQYEDASGTLADAVLTVSDDGGVVYTRNMKTDTECDILASEWTPENGKIYTLAVQVRSSSSLTASAIREVSVEFVLPQPAEIIIENDLETGYALLAVYVDKSDEMLESPVSISVWRESKDGRLLVDDELQDGAGVVDKYAPLNVDYQYIVTSYADSGAANSQKFQNRINSPWWFVYYESGMAKAMWEPSGSRSSRRTKDEMRERDGSEWPVLIQGRNKSHKVDFSGWVETKEEADAFEEMSLASGDKVYKGLKGEVFHCHAEADITDCYDYDDDSADVKVSIARVRGGAL